MNERYSSTDTKIQQVFITYLAAYSSLDGLLCDFFVVYFLSWNRMRLGYLYLGLQVAMATAAKAKLLLRELKTVKADLAFAKERCSQLEEENKILREAREKGVNPEDDDMVSACSCIIF